MSELFLRDVTFCPNRTPRPQNRLPSSALEANFAHPAAQHDCSSEELLPFAGSLLLGRHGQFRAKSAFASWYLRLLSFRLKVEYLGTARREQHGTRTDLFR